MLKVKVAGPESVRVPVVTFPTVSSIRPALEYACPVWHSSTKALESLQQRPESDENNISRQRLFAVAYCRQRWHARVTTRAADRAVLQKERFTGIVLSTLPAAGQTGLNHHRQTTSC